jgi:hypothetical protein
MTSPIQYCVTVDTEEEWNWDSGYTTGPTRVSNIQQLPAFHALCEQTGTAVVYFANHAVLSDPASCAIIQQLSSRPNTEIGLHIHPWNTPPLATTPSVTVRDSYLHNLPWNEQQAKLDSTLNAFASAGLQPTCFRGGRYSTSLQIQQYLRSRGLWVDSSVLPGTTWPDDGAPDYRERTLAPRRVIVNEERNEVVWELPLTFGNTASNQQRGYRLLKLADSKVGRLLHLTGVLDRLKIVSRCWLNFENPLGNRMLRYLDVLRTLRPPFVSFTLHSSSLLAGGSPYNRTEADVQRMKQRLVEVLQLVAKWPEFEPATLSTIASVLEATPR